MSAAVQAHLRESETATIARPRCGTLRLPLFVLSLLGVLLAANAALGAAHGPDYAT